MSARPAKTELKTELIAALSASLAQVSEAHRETLAGATHPEAKAEDDKDTRAIEQSYLARGQARRVEELEAAVAEVRAMPLRPFGPGKAAGVSAVVGVSENGEEKHYFIAPHGGGTALSDGLVHVVTPRSPLGRALVGKVAGDNLEVSIGGKLRELSVDSVE